MEAARGKGNRSANVSLEFYSNDQTSKSILEKSRGDIQNKKN